MKSKLGLAVILAMAGTLFICGVSMAGYCTDNGLSNGCIKRADIQNGAVGSAKIANFGVKNQDLADNAVNSAKVADNSLKADDLAAGSVGSSELQEDITLGWGSKIGNWWLGQAGNLKLTNSRGAETVAIDGQSGNATNTFASNGFIKAWAMINSDGTIRDCWRCNRDPVETRRLATGLYEVDFTPLATDIRSRPKMAIAYNNDTGGTGFVNVGLNDSHDSSTVIVNVGKSYNVGEWYDYPFTIMIF